jgi:CARDB
MRVSPFAGWSCLLPVAALLVASSARAQTCDFPLCASGSSYAPGGTDASGPFGVCNHCDWWGFCAHELVHCPAGSTLNATTGQCTHNLCLGGCGGELPLCDAPAVYDGSSTDASGRVYGVCKSCPFYLGGPISHELRYCRSGWSLQTASGQCFKNCLPDLVIRTGYLRSETGALISSVRVGQKYSICVLVANVGTAWAGPSFRVGGGGLGVPVAPFTTLGWLGPTASAEACVTYATTPSVGTWVVGVTADSTGVIAETDNGNNSFNVTVKVTP